MKKKIITEKTPTYSDFLPTAINKALLDKSLQHWTLHYSIPILSGVGLFGVVFGFSYHLFLVSLGIIGVVGIVFVNNLFFKAEKFKNSYTKKLLDILERKTNEKLKTLHKNLETFNNKHGAKQLEQFKQKFDILNEILKSKFDPGQLTFDRYFSIIQEVYLSGIDNLTNVVMAEKTLKSIDLNYINERLHELGAKNNTNMATTKEAEALNRSKKSFTEQKEKIGNLLAENEIALSQMDTAAIAISEISKSKDKQAQVDMDNSMKALTEIIERSKLYSR